MLNGLPASSWISAVRRAISRLHQPGEALQLARGRCGCRCAPCAPARAVSGSSMVVVELAQAALVDRRAKLLAELQRDVGVLLRRGAELEVEAAPRLLVERAAGGVGVQQEGVQHHVVRRSRAPRCPCRAAPAAPTSRRRRSSTRAGIFEPRPQRREMLGSARRALRRAATRGRCVSSANSPSRRFRDRHRDRRARAPEPVQQASIAAGDSSADNRARACPRSGPSSLAAGCGTPAPCRPP